MVRRLLASVAALAVCLVAGGIAASHASASLAVTGYADSDTTARQISASAAALTTVAIDGVNLTRSGASITSVSRANRATLAAAHKRGKRAELLIGNFDEKLGDFSPAIASKMLRSSKHRAAVVARLHREVRRHHWNGITVDLESLRRGDAPGLTAFVRALKHTVGKRVSVSVALMATTGSYRALGYDLPALARSADRLVLMGYDEHGPWSKSGAIGGMPWVKKTLSVLLHSVPASRVELGIAQYGYRWPGHSVSPRKARALVAHDHAHAVWSKKQQEWHARLRGGSVLWWSDARSYRARHALARKMHLRGVAVWSLTQADRIRR